MSDARACRLDELESVIDLCSGIFDSPTLEMRRDAPLLFNAENVDRLRIICEGDRVIAHAGYVRRESWILGASFTTASVGAVCTRPGYRGRGLASKVMDDLEAHAIAEGCDLLLVSGDLELYRRLGCAAAGSFPAFRIDAADLPGDRDITVRRAVPEDAAALVRLHQESPVRFERSVDDWRMLLGARTVMDVPGECWIVEYFGMPAAYLAAQSGSGDGIARIREYGGSVQAVWHALRHVAGDDASVEIVQMPGNRDIAFLAGETARRVD
ncbi:MAG: GNAT family N-acetyltransferase, partial [Chloroflexi bacterium]|nr:GNAT family N-acetyltransferase [Chloroflexota bacterium]